MDGSLISTSESAESSVQLFRSKLTAITKKKNLFIILFFLKNQPNINSVKQLGNYLQEIY